MKMTVQQVFNAHQTLTAIAGRPLPQKGAYRLARMHDQLKVEFDRIAPKYDALLFKYATPVPDTEPQRYAFTPAFNEAWGELAGEEIEVAVEPIPLALLDLGDSVAGAITAAELISLGELVTDA
jgi:hypothetical protein